MMDNNMKIVVKNPNFKFVMLNLGAFFLEIEGKTLKIKNFARS